MNPTSIPGVPAGWDRLRQLLTNRLDRLRRDGAPGDVDVAESAGEGDETARLEAALRRIEHGVYGDCIVCGEPIPLQRLIVEPAAERCAPCQALEDRLSAT